MTSQTYSAADDQIAPDNGLLVREDDHVESEANQMPADQDMPADGDAGGEVPAPDLARAWVTGHPVGSPAMAAPDDPGWAPLADVAPMIEVAPGPGMADTNAENGSRGLAPPAEPQSGAMPPPGIISTGSGGRWPEIQAMFVDDPRGSIELAAGLVDDRVEALVMSVKDRQQSLRSAWAGDAGTEELRMALQHYRAFWNGLEDLPA
jgi:hypothetical protein